MSGIANGLTERGFICDVLCSNTKPRYEEEFLNNVYVRRTKSYGELFSVSITPQLIHKFGEIASDYDIIHVHHPDPVAALGIFLHRPKARVIVHWHSDIVKQWIGLFFYKPIQNWLLRRSNLIICTSTNYISGSKHLTRFKEKTVAVPIGITSPNPVGKNFISDVKKRYANRFIVFSVGRFVYYKGFEYLIRSSQYLDDSFVIIIGGDGPLLKQCRELIGKAGLGHKVKLIGRLSSDELAAHYEACDIFCLPSVVKSEAFGIVMVEAMAYGKPIVSTKIEGSGVDWVNQNEMTGLTVNRKDPKELANAFIKLRNNKELRIEFGNSARSRFHNNFTISVMVDSIITHYNQVLAKRN